MEGFKEYFYKIIEEKLPELYDNKDKELNELLLKDYADKLNEKLIEILITDEKTKDKFFKKIKDVYVFNINDFKFYIDENRINNSYTQYENRIGLKFGSKLLRDTDDVEFVVDVIFFDNEEFHYESNIVNDFIPESKLTLVQENAKGFKRS